MIFVAVKENNPIITIQLIKTPKVLLKENDYCKHINNFTYNYGS